MTRFSVLCPAESAERQWQQLAIGGITDVGPGGSDGGVRGRRRSQRHLPHPAAPMVLTAEGGAPRWGADPPGQRRGGRSTARSLGQTQKFSGKRETVRARVCVKVHFLDLYLSLSLSASFHFSVSYNAHSNHSSDIRLRGS